MTSLLSKGLNSSILLVLPSILLVLSLIRHMILHLWYGILLLLRGLLPLLHFIRYLRWVSSLLDHLMLVYLLRVVLIQIRRLRPIHLLVCLLLLLLLLVLYLHLLLLLHLQLLLLWNLLRILLLLLLNNRRLLHTLSKRRRAWLHVVIVIPWDHRVSLIIPICLVMRIRLGRLSLKGLLWPSLCDIVVWIRPVHVSILLFYYKIIIIWVKNYLLWFDASNFMW